MSNRSSWIVVFVAVIASLTLSGCGTFRLYSDVRDKQGVAAKKAWEEVDLKEIVTTERSNLNMLLEAELETQDRLAAGIRNYTLRNMVDSKSLDEGLVQRVDVRLKELVGSPALLTNSLAAREKQRAAELSLAGTFSPDFERKTLPLPSCPALAGGAVPPSVIKWMATANDVDKAEMTRILAEMRKKCDDSSIDELVYGALGGQTRSAWEQYRFDAAQLATSRQEAATLQKAYLDAAKEYERAVNASQSSPEAVEAVQKALEKLNKALAALDKAQDAFSVSFLSEERLKSIDKLVVAVTETPPGGKLPADADQATLAFILIPRLIDDARKSLADARKPLAIPLLMRRNYEQLNLEAAKRDIAAREAMLRLSREIVAALYQQAIQLYMASNELHETGLTNGQPNGRPNITQYYNLTVLDAFSKPPPRDKELIYSAAARYLDALNRLDAKRYKLEYMRLAAIHERSLAYAEVNIQQWQSLIGITVDQVAEFSAGGIRPETIGNLINTLGLIWIGVGVNK